MDWRNPPGRLNEVRRLTKETIAERTADIEANGPYVCMACGFQGHQHQLIDRGVCEYNPATKLFDIPSTQGRCVYECPQCHYLGNESGREVTGILHMVGWWPMKGEWYPVECEDDQCLSKGGTYIALGCPGCGQFCYWHHASNHTPHNEHAWGVQISPDGQILTMSPSLFENPSRGGCHFFIRDNKVQWC